MKRENFSGDSKITKDRCPTSRGWIGSGLAFCVLLLLSSDLAMATTVYVVPSDSTTCDDLDLQGLPGAMVAQVDELGTTTAFPLDERIQAQFTSTEEVACQMNPGPNTGGNQVVVSITNTVFPARDFYDLWYVADPETSITNIDGTINGESAFKIDRADANRSLIFESDTVSPNDGIFRSGETWHFVIDGYTNSLLTDPDAMASLGVGDGSGSPGQTISMSSGSIIASLVPEPNSALLLGLGLSGLSAFGGRRSRRSILRPAPLLCWNSVIRARTVCVRLKKIKMMQFDHDSIHAAIDPGPMTFRENPEKN
jgi:hypothetical protein